MPLHVRLLFLSLAAGCVDATAFVHAGVFPANMTGNSVVLALALVHVNVVGGATLPAIALGGFCLGAALGARLVRNTPATSSQGTGLALGLGGGLLLGAGGLIAAGAGILPSILLASAAMGLQGAVGQSLGVAGVSTVVVTGALTTAIGRLVGAPVLSPDPLRAVARLPAGSWVSYFVGALVGGLQAAPHFGGLVMLPGLILLGMAWRWRRV